MAQEYKYTYLEEGRIRIFHLQPELNEGFLHGTLQDVALEDAKDTYVAVSWTWGDEPEADDHKQIKVDGKLLPVRLNLWEMLNTFREHNNSSIFWIDAICIDQDKSQPKEKNHQIPMMASIFTSAKEVHVWLGPSADDSDHVMDTVRDDAEQADATEEAFTTNRFAVALFKMFERRWWTRTWILQEYVLNRTEPKVFCGQGSGVWIEYMLGIWIRPGTKDMVAQGDEDRSKWSVPAPVYWLIHVRRTIQDPNFVLMPCNLQNALIWLKRFAATEPRDKIYGALGLLETQYRERFVETVGVHSEKASAEVYWDAMIYLLKFEQTFVIFHEFPIGRHDGLNAPTWVPNFGLKITSATGTGIPLLGLESKHQNLSRKDVNVSDDRLRLSVEGQILGRVMDMVVIGNETKIVSDTGIERVNVSLRMPHLLHKIQNLVDQHRSGPPFEKSLSEPLWKTLAADSFDSGEEAEFGDEEVCQQRFDEMMAMSLPDLADVHNEGDVLRRLIYQSTSTSEEKLRKFKTFIQIVRLRERKPRIFDRIESTLLPGRVFFTAEYGHYGLSEAGIQEGDLIALLFPDNFIPFILRECDDTYEMVSVAYIPTPMKDAAIAEIERDRSLLKTFDIV